MDSSFLKHASKPTKGDSKPPRGCPAALTGPAASHNPGQAEQHTLAGGHGTQTRPYQCVTGHAQELPRARRWKLIIKRTMPAVAQEPAFSPQ